MAKIGEDLSACGQEELDILLMGAACEGAPERLAKIVEAGANPRIKDRDGATPLMAAAERLRLGCVRALAGLSDVRAADIRGRDAMMRAALAIREAGVERRVRAEACASLGGGGEGQAAAQCREIVALLAPMADLSARDERGRSALDLAALVGNAAALDGLLRGGADPLAQGPDGSSALMLAAGGGRLSCAEMLLPASDPLAKDKSGCTALMQAAFWGKAACVELLLPASDLAAVDQYGRSAMEMGRQGRDPSMCDLISKLQAASEKSGLEAAVAAAAASKRRGAL